MPVLVMRGSVWLCANHTCSNAFLDHIKPAEAACAVCGDKWTKKTFAVCGMTHAELKNDYQRQRAEIQVMHERAKRESTAWAVVAADPYVQQAANVPLSDDEDD